MIEIGKYQTLKILRDTSIGIYLGDEDGEEVLLPNKYCPEESNIGDELHVFVYLDYAERKIATNLEPRILLHEFAYLQVAATSDVGAFLDWGLEKDLFVPFREQQQRMVEGEWYVVYLDLDQTSQRLYASSKIDKFLKNVDLPYKEGEEVSLLIAKKSELGYTVIINQQHQGIVYDNEVFSNINIGDETQGYIKTIRPDQKIDVSLSPIGYRQFNDVNSQLIYDYLIQNNGFLPLTDKSSPVEIYAIFGISKKAFKKAVGSLYKERKITIEADGIKKT